MCDNKDKDEIYSEEIQSILEARHPYIERNYLRIRESYFKPYNDPELDPLRHEITICILLGLSQAAITLTNHFLEQFLKYALSAYFMMSKESSLVRSKESMVSDLQDLTKEARTKYGANNLETNINIACSQGLISKDNKSTLKSFKDRFRNAYGHADKSKTFGDSTVPVTGLRIGPAGVETGQSAETEVADFLIGQGLIQAEIAGQLAPDYFLYMDALARSVLKKIHSVDNEDGDQASD